MMDRRFIKAEVVELAANTWKLSVTYSYFGLFEFVEVFVFPSQNDCLLKLAYERCPVLTLKKIDGELISACPGNG